MTDLINRTDLIAHLNACLAESDGHTPLTDAVLMAVKCAVEQMPAIDAEPIIYGRWLHIADDYSVVECSECGCTAKLTPFNGDSIYCSHCGAKMEKTNG